MHDTTVWEVLATVATVLAALAAVGSVLYLEVVQPRLLQPKLLPPVLQRGRPEYEATVHPEDFTEHWLRLRISSAPHRDTAEDVEVIFIGKRSGRSENLLPIEPRNLRWSATTPSRKAGKYLDLLSDDAPEPRTRLRLPAGTYRYVDVLQATDSSAVSDVEQRKPRVCTRPFHPDRHVLSPGLFRLYFALTAMEITTLYFALDIAWDGEWRDDETWWQHLVPHQLSMLTRLPEDI